MMPRTTPAVVATVLTGLGIFFLALPLGADDGLIRAARENDLTAVRQLLDDGADINGTDRFGITPLWQACWKGHTEMACLLLESGANPDLADHVWQVTPLTNAADPEMITLLVRHGAADAEAKLRDAAFAGQRDVVEAILRGKEFEPDALAQALAQARLADNKEIANLLQQSTALPIPDLEAVEPELLSRLVGTYVDERFNELYVEFQDGRLRVGPAAGRTTPAAAVNANTVQRGGTTIQFQLDGNAVRGLIQLDGATRNEYHWVAGETIESTLPALRDDLALDSDVATRDQWPSFRGAQARGIAIAQDLPDAWDVEQGIGVVWKTEVPGLSNAAPVVFGERVFVATAVSSAGNHQMRIGLYGAGDAAEDQSEHAWQLHCLDVRTGERLWQQTAEQREPPVKRHQKSTQANPTPATDGRYLVVLFNSGGLYCYTMDGQLVWNRDLGRLDSGAFNDPEYQWGFGSSPVIDDDRVFVQCDIQQGSFLAAYKLADGSEIWKVARDEVPSWGTPTVHDTPRGPMVITNATHYARGYDARTGEELWRLGGHAAITVPTPQVSRGLIFITSGYRPIQPIYALRTDAAGDISLDPQESTSSYVAWSHLRGGPYLPTPLVYGAYFYTCANNGILTCYLAETGQQVYRQRFASGTAGSFTASPVAADGKIYLTSEAGIVYVVRAGPRYQLIEQNSLGEYCLATPAIANGMILFRTHQHLVAIGRPNRQ